MRPCVRCRAPIENSFVLCPHCRAPQDGGTPKANPAPDPPQPSLARRVGSTVFGFMALLAYLMFPFPLFGGIIGHAAGGMMGMTAGIIAGIALAIFLQVLAESGG